MSFVEFVRAASPLLIPAVAMFGTVFASTIAAARSGGVRSLGEIAALIAVFAAVAAPAAAVQAAIATGVWPNVDATSSAGRRVVASFRALAGPGLAWVAFAAIALLLASAALDLSVVAAVLSLAGVVAALVASVPIAHVYAIVGRRPIMVIGLTTAATAVALALGIASAGPDRSTAAAIAIVSAEALSAVLGFWRIHAVSRAHRRASSDRFFLGGSFQGIVLATFGLFLFSIVDVPIARYHLGETSGSLYAGVAIVGRLLVLVPGMAIVLVAPSLSALRVDDPFRWLRRSIAISGVGILVIVALLSIFRTQILTELLGRRFDVSADALPLSAVAAGLLATLWQLSLFHKTVRSRAHAANLVLVAALSVVCAFVPLSRDRLTVLMVGATGVAVLFQYFGARAICRWSPPLSLLSPHEEVPSAEPVAAANVELSVILPCRNAGPSVREFIGTLIEQLEALTSYEIIIVSDGSTDETVEIASRFASPTVRVLHYDRRSGKGHALRVGLNRARGEYVGYIDSDGDIDPEAIGPFLSLMKLYGLDIVLGSKRHPMSEVNYPPLRRVMSWTYHKIARLLFRIDVRDTQTGFKVIRRDVAAAVLPRMLEKRYAFDLELLVIARLLGFRKVFEAPVHIEYQFSSNVVPSTAFRILVDTAAIFYRRYILNTYSYASDRLVVASPESDGATDVVQGQPI
jgi:Glycosyl transferase family 2